MNADMIAHPLEVHNTDATSRDPMRVHPMTPASVRWLLSHVVPGGNKIRSGYTKNHGQPRNKVREKMVRASRRANRQRR